MPLSLTQHKGLLNTLWLSPFNASNSELTTATGQPNNCLLRLGQRAGGFRGHPPTQLLLPESRPGPPLHVSQPAWGSRSSLILFPIFLPSPEGAPSRALPQSTPASRPDTCSEAGSGPPRQPPAIPGAAAGASCPTPAPAARMRPRREPTFSARAAEGAHGADWAPRGGGAARAPPRPPSAGRKWAGRTARIGLLAGAGVRARLGGRLLRDGSGRGARLRACVRAAVGPGEEAGAGCERWAPVRAQERLWIWPSPGPQWPWGSRSVAGDPSQRAGDRGLQPASL